MFRIMEPVSQNERRRVCFVEFAGWRHRGEVCRLRPYLTVSSQWGVAWNFCLRSKTYNAFFYQDLSTNLQESGHSGVPTTPKTFLSDLRKSHKPLRSWLHPCHFMTTIFIHVGPYRNIVIAFLTPRNSKNNVSYRDKSV